MVETVIIEVSRFLITSTQVAVLLGFGSGLFAGEAFMNFDGMVKYKDGWFGGLPLWKQNLVSIILDMSHHFQYGLVMVLYAMINPWLIAHPIIALVISSYGWGLVVSDWKDVEHVLERLGFLVKEVHGV